MNDLDKLKAKHKKEFKELQEALSGVIKLCNGALKKLPKPKPSPKI